MCCDNCRQLLEAGVGGGHRIRGLRHADQFEFLSSKFAIGILSKGDGAGDTPAQVYFEIPKLGLGLGILRGGPLRPKDHPAALLPPEPIQCLSGGDGGSIRSYSKLGERQGISEPDHKNGGGAFPNAKSPGLLIWNRNRIQNLPRPNFEKEHDFGQEPEQREGHL